MDRIKGEDYQVHDNIFTILTSLVVLFAQILSIFSVKSIFVEENDVIRREGIFKEREDLDNV